VGGIVEEARKSQDGIGSISGLWLEETLRARSIQATSWFLKQQGIELNFTSFIL
jgi:hypothetical protein